MSEDKTPIPVAVALRYEQGKDNAPVITAKGRGAIAEKIIATAREHGVVVEGNPVLAEALSHVDLDRQIPENLFRAVAEVIGFVLRTTRQKGR